jgi:hypothetical protein
MSRAQYASVATGIMFARAHGIPKAMLTMNRPDESPTKNLQLAQRKMSIQSQRAG